MSKRIIKQLISRDYLEEAIELMLELVGKYGEGSSVENTLYNISGQYYSNEQGKRGSTITGEAYGTAKNRLRGNLSEILDDNFLEIDEEDIPEAYKRRLKESPKPPDPSTASEKASNDGRKILVLSANPHTTDRLDINLERARIAEKLEKTDFVVVSRKGVTRSRFAELIYEEKPSIVHFSGHGEVRGSSETKESYVDVERGIGKPEKNKSDHEPNQPENQAGIILMDDDLRNASFVKASRLKRTFKSLVHNQGIDIKAVIFNACYSEEQAKAISEVGISVIGTSSAIKDVAAIAFSSGFYYAIGKGESIEDALDWAINGVLDFDEPEDRFILYKDGKKQDI